MSSFDEAKKCCAAEGARLWQPRNWNTFETIKELEAQVLEHLVEFTSNDSYLAIGLEMVHDGINQTTPFYPDGAKVPENLASLPWFPSTWITDDASLSCVAFHQGGLINVPCDGYFNGSGSQSQSHLGYICEARILEGIKAKAKVACHTPFLAGGQMHYSCVQETHPEPEPFGTVGSSEQPWCPTAVDNLGQAVPGTEVPCQDERSIVINATEEVMISGEYCAMPFLMNEK